MTRTAELNSQASNSAPILRASSLCKRFGGLQSVNNVSFEAHAGELLCLIGANGAGKTTVFNLLTGFYSPDAGNVELCGRDITALSPAKRAGLGVARTFQNLRLLDDETVLENVLTAQRGELKYSLLNALLHSRQARLAERDQRDVAMALLTQAGLADMAGRTADELPYGLRKSLELTRALAMQPKLLLLDEPASGLTPQEAVSLAEWILRIKSPGLAIIVIEHNLRVVRSLADRVLLMQQGEAIWQGRAADMADSPVIASYLGHAPARRKET